MTGSSIPSPFTAGAIDGRRRVAAFDFDGTITQQDTLAGFLAAAGGRRRLGTSMAIDTPGMARGLRNDEIRDATKERILGRVLRGRTDDDLRISGRAYAALLPARFRPATIERLQWHQRQGHQTVIVSASLVYYLDPVAAALGVDAVIGVEMAIGSDGLLSGGLARPNVRASEKARRLRAWLDATGADIDQPVELWAYGNSSGDDQLLAMAAHPTWVGKRASRNA